MTISQKKLPEMSKKNFRIVQKLLKIAEMFINSHKNSRYVQKTKFPEILRNVKKVPNVRKFPKKSSRISKNVLT